MPPDLPPDIVNDDSMDDLLAFSARVQQRWNELRAQGKSDEEIAQIFATEFPPEPEED